MQVLAGLCLLLFVATVSVVGVRMLLLASRTRGRHELLMGLGMVQVGMLGYPLTLVAGFGRPVGELNLPLWVAGSLVTDLGLALIYAFTWQVFRPAARWGAALCAAGLAFMLAGLAGATRALATAPPEASSQLVVRGWLFVSMVGFWGCFLWSAIEGFVQHRMARRRLALGLADPVVADRFWLWGVFGLSASAINATSSIANALGLDPSRSPLVLVPMGVLGAVASVAMYLAFLPPAWYLGRVRAHAPPA
jgi:hypothetical protein